jgi:hypothetical protein
MSRPLAFVLAIAGWYLLNPPANHHGNPDSHQALSQWNIDGPYGTAADCDVAYHDDLNSMIGG